uniref:Uncharacterized protein n=1 Tax=Oryza punctata TaxID=4537 RepID=A0A0E0KMA3_ORYPU
MDGLARGMTAAGLSSSMKKDVMFAFARLCLIWIKEYDKEKKRSGLSVAGECLKINKLAAANPVKVVQVQKQSKEKSSSSAAAAAVKVVVSKQLMKPRFAVELDGLNCFETLVPR